jgi:Ca2+-binding RTX toxin-like protein
MATLTLAYDFSIDMTRGIMPAGDLVEMGWQGFSRHSLAYIDEYGDYAVDEFYGTGFGYDWLGNLAVGWIEEIDRYVEGDLAFTLTGGEISVATVMDYVDYGDAYGEVDYVFRGHDFIEGGDYADTLAGMAGDDDIYGGAGGDDLFGYDGWDYIRGEEGDDWISGGGDFDDLHGNTGHDTIYGGASDDWVVGGKDDDDLYGDEGFDIVLGNLGADYVFGGAGDDWVRGGQGDDEVRGGAGWDFLSGDRGNDTLEGGSGADLFHVFGQSDRDVVVDFTAAEGDQVMVLAGSVYTVAQVGADLTITIDASAVMVLQNVQLSTLPAGWIFAG